MELLEQNAIGVWSLNSAFHPSDRTQAANELGQQLCPSIFCRLSEIKGGATT